MDQSQFSGKQLMTNIKLEDKQLYESKDIPMVKAEKDDNISVDETEEVQKVSVVDANKDVSVDETEEVQKISMVDANKDVSLGKPMDNENIPDDGSEKIKEDSISKIFHQTEF